MAKKRKKPKVLIVDDEKNLTLSMVDFLGERMETYGAYSYEEAVRFLKKRPVDLVISDIKLPGKDGFDLLLWLKENLPLVKVIMITAYGSPSMKGKAKEQGAILYIEKPVDLNQLIRIVDKIFQQKGTSIPINELEIMDLLQFLSFHEKSAVIEIKNNTGEPGKIGIKDGNVMWAKAGDLTGQEAFMTMITWKEGNFSTGEYYEEDKGRIEEPIMQLVLEASKIREERKAKGKEEFEIIVKKNKNLKRKGGVKMATLEGILEKFGSEVPELIETVIVRIDDGISIGGFSANPNFDLATSSAAYAEVIKSHSKAVELIGTDLVGETEDILITMENTYFLLRMLGEKHYHGLAITKKGNLGLSRVIMKKYEPLFMEGLKGLGEL